MEKHKKSKKRIRIGILSFIFLLLCSIYTVRDLFFSAPEVGHFKSQAGQEDYQHYYDKVLGSLEAQPVRHDVETTWGTYRVYEWRPEAVKDKTPILLFPGHSSGAPMWRDLIPYLLKDRPVYAFDALGDAGMSKQSLPFEDTKAVSQAVDQMTTGLKLDNVHLVGHSFGSSTAAGYAKYYPENVASLTLLEPAFALNYPKASVFFWATISGLDFLPESWRNKALAEISGEEVSDVASQDDMALMIKAASASYSNELPTPQPISEEVLKSWKFPVYLALAEKSKVTSQSTADNAKAIKNLTMKKWKNTTHSLPMEVPAELTQELINFWKKAEE